MMECVNIGIKRPSTLPLANVELIMVVIKVVVMVDLDIGLKIPATLPLTILDQELMFTGEVDTCIILATHTHIT